MDLSVSRTSSPSYMDLAKVAKNLQCDRCRWYRYLLLPGVEFARLWGIIEGDLDED
jgi:hypothetical protein